MSALDFHDSREAEARDRGFGLGRAHPSAVENTVRVYRRLFAEAGVDSHEVMGFGNRMAVALESCGEQQQVDEIEGIAAGAGVESWELLAINGRTELLVGRTASECSLIGLAPEASEERLCLLAQNWDWHPDLAASMLLWRVQAEPCSFATLTEAGVLAKIGLNDRRICCGLNFLASSQDARAASSDSVHLILRRILERAETMAEAVSIVHGARPTASAAISIGCGQSGQEGVISLELTPRAVHRPAAAVAGTVAHTNHFLADIKPTADVTGVNDDLAGSKWRLRQLEQLAGRKPSRVQIREQLASHEGGAFGVCAHQDSDRAWSVQYITLATVVIDASSCEIWVSDGRPCGTGPGRTLGLDFSVS